MKVELECGCTTEMDHKQGDRLFVCNCERSWVVKSNRQVIVTYMVHETQNVRVA